MPLLLSSALRATNSVQSGTAQEQWHTEEMHQLTCDAALAVDPGLHARRTNNHAHAIAGPGIHSLHQA